MPRDTAYDVSESRTMQVAILADMIRRSSQCVAYTGAGISVAAGINDYATARNQNPEAMVNQTSWLDAQPTLCHRCLLIGCSALAYYWLKGARGHAQKRGTAALGAAES